MIAVTGSSGFIGKYVVRKLERLDVKVVEIDRKFGTDITLDPIPLEHCQAVIHLAGVLGTSELFDDAERAVDVNVKGTLRVLDAALEHRAAYVGITMPDCWPSLYQASKLCGVRLASAYHHAHGLPVTHIRAFNAFGLGQANGESHPAKIVPTLAAASWRGEPMPIYGNGLQTTDLVSASHVADCLIKAAIGGLPTNDQTWDAGSGIETSVLDVSQMVAEITGNDSVALLKMRVGELPDTKLCAKDFGPLSPYEFDKNDFRATVESYR